MSKRRVVVTGMGTVTPLGLSVEETWKNILASQSGVSTISHFDVGDSPTKISASVKGFQAEQFVSLKEIKKMDVFVLYAIAAAQEALQDSGLDLNTVDKNRFGVSVGSGIGGMPMIEKTCDALFAGGPRKVSPFFVPSAIINMASGQISIMHGFRGPNVALVSACSTGSHCIGYSVRTIQYGDADFMLAGGSEMADCALGMAGFTSMRAMSRRNDEPTKASRPWDKDRDGFVLGDGAGVLLLEEYEHAKRRGAKIYAEIIGVGMSADAYHITSPDENGLGAMLSMQNALNDAHLNPGQIDYINAHSTSTPTGDVLELLAIKKTFGQHAYDLCVSSTKSMTGHLLGAAGAVEAIFSILAIRDQVAPPTINLDNPDEGCDLNLVAHVPQERTMRITMSNSFGFGGTNGTLIFAPI